VSHLNTSIRPGTLRGFLPFNRLDADLLIIAATRCEPLTLAAGGLLFQRDTNDPFEYYLLAGSLELHEGGGEPPRTLTAQTPAAFQPIARERPTICAVRAKVESQLVRIPRETIGLLWEANPKAAPRPYADLDFTQPVPFLQEMERILTGSRLHLLSPPVVAHPLRWLADRLPPDRATMARILSLDPVIALKIFRIASSPLFRIADVQDLLGAIEGLRPELAAELAVCYCVKHLLPEGVVAFRTVSQQAVIEAINIAAISRLLARRTDHLDPERAYLAGLFHNLGIWLLLTVAADGPEKLHQTDAIHIAVRRLAAPLGGLLLHRLGLGEDLARAALAGGDFRKGEGEPLDLAGVVRLARYHFLLQANRRRLLPKWTEIPTFRVFPGGEFTPQKSLEILAEARQEIALTHKLLNDLPQH